jgi:hypothetical protein
MKLTDKELQMAREAGFLVDHVGMYAKYYINNNHAKIYLGQELEKLIELVRADSANEWISVYVALPNDGINIIGLNAANPEPNTWTETFDNTEPLGFMTHWQPAPNLNE